MWQCDIFLVILEKWVIRKYKKRLNLKIGDTCSLFCFEILCWFTILRFAAANILIIYIFWWHLCYRMHHIWIYPSSWIFSDVVNVIHILQHIWTPDVIIHDLVRFNKPEILNQVQKFIKTSVFSNENIWEKNIYTQKFATEINVQQWCPRWEHWRSSGTRGCTTKWEATSPSCARPWSSPSTPSTTTSATWSSPAVRKIFEKVLWKYSTPLSNITLHSCL